MRRISRLLAAGAMVWLASFACASAGVVVNPQNVDTLPYDAANAVNIARQRVAAGDLPGAIKGLAGYVAFHPGDIVPERLLGDLYFRQANLSKAEETYLHILTYAPGDKETHNRLGSVYATENRIDEAIREFNRSLPGTDSVPDLVRLHLIKGDFPRYRQEREKAARDWPSDSEAQQELGQVYEAVHQPGMAVIYFKRALDDDPNSTDAMSGLGLSYMDLARYPDAIDQFKQCLGHDGYDYACMNNLGATYLQMQQFSQAESILNNAHRLEPERSEALVNLGYLADSRGNWKQAVTYYVDAMTVYPYSPDAYIDLGYTYNLHGQYKLAQAALIKGLSVDPQDGRLHFLLGEAYEHQGMHTLATAQFKVAAGADDLDPDVKRLAQERIAALERAPASPHP